MNTMKLISTLMTKELFTVSPKDTLKAVKKIFETKTIYHIPVVKGKKVVGLVSKTSLLDFMVDKASERNQDLNGEILERYRAEDIMAKEVAQLESSDHLLVAIAAFTENRSQAMPVIDGEELVGMVSSHDIMRALSEERMSII